MLTGFNLVDYMLLQNRTKFLISLLDDEKTFLLMVFLPRHALREELIPDDHQTLRTLFTMVQNSQGIEFMSELLRATGDNIPNKSE